MLVNTKIVDNAPIPEETKPKKTRALCTPKASYRSKGHYNNDRSVSGVKT